MAYKSRSYLQDVRLLNWLLLLLCLSAASPTTRAATNELRVMSFNIWVNGGTSLDRCIEAIRQSGADVVGLQECNAETAAKIGAALGFHVQGDSGRSIVSRYPILASLPVSGGRGATIELPTGRRIHLFNCHLTAYPYGPYDLKAGKSWDFILAQEQTTRMPALTNLLAGMKPFLATNEPCFLTGDFNVPSHLDYVEVPWPNSVACETAGLGDSYRELHPGNRRYPERFRFDEPGITWTPKVSEEPEGVFDRIDFVYYSQGDGVTPVSSIELDARNNVDPWPSDHRAVLTIFRLAPPLP